MVQLSQLSVDTGKTMDLTIRTAVGRVMSGFQHTVLISHRSPAKKQMSSDFMAAVTIRSDFRAPQK